MAQHMIPMTVATAPVQATIPPTRFALTGVDLPELRRRVGLSAAEMARRLGYSRSAIHLWESGRRDIPPEQIGRIVETLQAARLEMEAWRQQVARLQGAQ